MIRFINGVVKICDNSQVKVMHTQLFRKQEYLTLSKRLSITVSHPWNRLPSNLLKPLTLEVGKPKHTDINKGSR